MYENYKVVKAKKATEIAAVKFIDDITDPINFGYWGDLFTKVIWFFIGLGISSLVLSGICKKVDETVLFKIEDLIKGTQFRLNMSLP